MKFLTKKKVILRCVGTFLVSCVNPIAGVIVASINIKSCIDDYHGDQNMKDIIPLLMNGKKKGYF